MFDSIDAKDADTVRILHLTDLHLRWHQPGTAEKPERLSREIPEVLRRLNARIGEIAPDVVVATGDLLDVPYPVIRAELGAAELAKGRAAAKADYDLLRELFADFDVPTIALPGNHDDLAIFDEAFGYPERIVDHAGLRFVAFHDDLNPDRSPKRLPSERARFETVLRAPEHDRPQVHLQHYLIEPPTDAGGWRYDYPESREMAAAIAESGRVRLVLSGHYHPGRLFAAPHGTCYSVPLAFCSARHPFRVMDVRRSGGITVNNMAVDA